MKTYKDDTICGVHKESFCMAYVNGMIHAGCGPKIDLDLFRQWLDEFALLKDYIDITEREKDELVDYMNRRIPAIYVTAKYATLHGNN